MRLPTLSLSLFLTLLLTFTTLTHAQDFEFANIPSCALTCFTTAIPAAGCALTDPVCQCTTGRDNITASVVECVPDSCEVENMEKIAPAVREFCESLGVTLSGLPTAVATGPMATGGSTASVTQVEGEASVSAAESAAPTEFAGGAGTRGVGVGMGAVVVGVAAFWGV